MYKQASKLKLRFQTSHGVLSAEQLWDLSMTDLTNGIRALKKVLKKDDDDDLSFLEASNTVDVKSQLRFDILKDIYLTKKSEAAQRANERDTKAFNAKIDALIAEKEDGQLKEMSIEDLMKLRIQ